MSIFFKRSVNHIKVEGSPHAYTSNTELIDTALDYLGNARKRKYHNGPINEMVVVFEKNKLHIQKTGIL